MIKSFTFVAIPLAVLSLAACSITNLNIGFSKDQEQNRILFQDDFSDPSSGWSSVNEQNLIMGYDNGRFRVWVNRPNVDTWTIANLRFGDARISVDTARISGPEDNEIGIICRYSNPGNFYGFLISSDGYYGISKRQDGNYQVLSYDGMRFSELIKQGNATNHIQAECVGESLKLIVNGSLLAEVTDASYQSGDVGLLVGSYDQPGVDVIFDNFVVTHP
jgi:hypothetical protein